MNIKIIKEENFVELIDDDIVNEVYIENEKEIVELKMSEALIDYLFKKINLDEYKKFIILTFLVPYCKYNVITDKKGIWGLSNQMKGLYENSYVNNSGKVYFGITNNINQQELDGLVDTLEVYVPSRNYFPYEEIFDLFSETKYDFNLENQFFEQIQKCIPGSLIIKYTNASIMLYSNGIEKKF